MELYSNESVFFNLMKAASQQRGIPDKYVLNRLSDGTINVRYGPYQIGRVRLVKKKRGAQILTGQSTGDATVTWIQGNDEELKEVIPFWLNYIEYNAFHTRPTHNHYTRRHNSDTAVNKFIKQALSFFTNRG